MGGIDERLWSWFSGYVNIPFSEMTKLQSLRGSNQAVIPHLVSTHPALSWMLVANALYQMGPGGGGDSCHRALDHLQQLFPTGNAYTNTW